MFVSYARAFNESRGNPPLPKAPTSALSSTERETHRWALDERDKVWGHVDRGGHRRATEVLEGAGLALVEQWTSPTREQFAALAALAEKLAESYDAEAKEVAREMRD